MAANLKTLALLAGTMLAINAMAEETLRDPTRPPFELLPSLDGGTVSAPPAPPGLQSVILSATREAAIISGTEVEVGQKYGDATLVVVNETCVVLNGPQGRRVMYMFPTVNLSKTQLACAGRSGLPVIRKVAKAKPARKAQKSKSRPVNNKVSTCGCDESKNGSQK